MAKVVFVDGVNKGEVFKKNNRWHWRRGAVAVEPFSKRSNLSDVAEWARKCCNGKVAVVKNLKEPSNDKLAKALNDSGVFKPFACVPKK